MASSSPRRSRRRCAADTILVSLMHVNNEIGVVQDVGCRRPAVPRARRAVPRRRRAERRQAAARRRARLHRPAGADRAQGARAEGRRRAVRAAASRASVSCRCCTVAARSAACAPARCRPTRSSAWASRCRIAALEMAADAARIARLRDRLWQGLAAAARASTLNGHPSSACRASSASAIDGVEGESLLFALPGLAVASGSACATTSGEPSYVLRALGRSDRLAQSSLRLSLGRFTTAADDRAGDRGDPWPRSTGCAPSRRASGDVTDDDPRYGARGARPHGDARRGGRFAAGAPSVVPGRAGDRSRAPRSCSQLPRRGRPGRGGALPGLRLSAFPRGGVLADRPAAWCGPRRISRRWDWREAAAALEVPPAKFGRLLTLQDAVRAAGGELARRQRRLPCRIRPQLGGPHARHDRLPHPVRPPNECAAFLAKRGARRRAAPRRQEDRLLRLRLRRQLRGRGRRPATSCSRTAASG